MKDIKFFSKHRNLLSFLIILGSCFFIFSHHADALTLNANNIPVDIRQIAQSACQQTRNGTAEIAWISLAGNPLADGTASNPIPMKAGQNVSLQWNVAGKYCNAGPIDPDYNPSSPYYTIVADQRATNYLGINVYVASGNGTVSGFQSNQIFPLQWNQAYVYQQVVSSQPFLFSANQSGQVTINSQFKAINTFFNGRWNNYQCVGTFWPAGRVWGPNDYLRCPLFTGPMSFYITVVPNIVTEKGLVYYFDGGGSEGLAGVPVSVTDCNNNTIITTVTNGNSGGDSLDPPGGHYSFSIAGGTTFCINVPAKYVSPNGTTYEDPVITPAYILPNSPPFTETGKCGLNNAYNNQNAESGASPGRCNYGIDDGSYNFAYTKKSNPATYFDVMSPPGTDVKSIQFTGGTADPTSVTIDTNIQVKFTQQDGSTSPYDMKVNGLRYVGVYVIEHADGSTSPLANDSTDLNVGSTTTNGAIVTHDYTKTYSVSVPPLAVGDQVCAEFTVSPAHGQMDENGNQVAGSTSGSVDSSPIPRNYTCSGPIDNQPYSRAYGNDVAAGPQFAGTAFSCDPANARIIASSSESTKQPRGSGAQFAAMSLGSIENYSSAFLRTLSPYGVNGLTLANSDPGYGGNFVDNSGNCPTVFNYYAMKPSNIAAVNAGGLYTLSLNPQLSGKNLIYVDGNVYIPNNISFAPATIDPSTGAVNGTSLYVIALGNIYIGPGVTNLDGVFVAENQCDINKPPVDGCASFNAQYGGLINTCSDVKSSSSSKPFAQDKIYSACISQLTVRGSLIADQIKLDRTYGSIRNSVSAENPISGKPHDCSKGNYLSGNVPTSEVDCSSEVFNFDPTNYSDNPGINSDQRITYDSIVSLPPVL